LKERRLLMGTQVDWRKISERQEGAQITLRPRKVPFLDLKKLGWILREERGIKEAYQELTKNPDLLTPGNAACLGCHAEMALRITLRFFGPNTILAIPPSCMGGISVVGYGPTMGAKVPVFFPLLTNTASMLAGIKRALRRMGRDDITVLAFAGDGGTADAGFQALSGAAERGENIIYICYDNEGYMNTGIQRSGTTPRFAWTNTTPVGEAGRGKRQKGKDMAMIMAMHGVPYVATANPSFVPDYLSKLRRAKEIKDGLVYIHLFSGCPTGWKFPTENTVEVGRLATETGIFPLWECDHGKFRITYSPRKRLPVSAYTRTMDKYAHLSQEELDELQRMVDEKWKWLEAMSKL
jgi:pyruvate/2-oxoacid:ferredoxin oxidoreductase beta subunit